MEKSQEPFKKERKQTDDSLTLERGKTDASFDDEHKNTQLTTDELVAKDRVEADKKRLKQRIQADSMRENTAGPEAPAKALDNEIEKALIHQRESEDKAIENERLNTDKILQHERKEKEKLISKIVGEERQATDKNLSQERTKTDIETERAEVLLTEEVAQHVKTKSELTTREEFVAIVSHDLRNPLGAILSATDVLLEDPAGAGINEDAKTWIHLIRRNAETSLRLITDILDMERIVEGKLQLQLTKNQIDVLIHDIMQSYQHVASAKKILLSSSPANSGTTMCDKDRVAQILSNLIGNALKFTPDNGSVTIESKETESEITVSVTDTGPGIPDDQKQRIFERFAQIGNKQRSGIGLGLFISKTLVESHSGKLWVISTPGSGSTFWFTLPKK